MKSEFIRTDQHHKNLIIDQDVYKYQMHSRISMTPSMVLLLRPGSSVLEQLIYQQTYVGQPCVPHTEVLRTLGGDRIDGPCSVGAPVTFQGEESGHHASKYLSKNISERESCYKENKTG